MFKLFKKLLKAKRRIVPCQHKWLEGQGHALGRRHCTKCNRRQVLYAELQPRTHWRDCYDHHLDN